MVKQAVGQNARRSEVDLLVATGYRATDVVECSRRLHSECARHATGSWGRQPALV